MIDGVYFDGRVSVRRNVRVEITPARVIVHSADYVQEFTHADIELSEALGTTPRALALPGGARIDLPNAPELALLAARAPAGFALVNTLERHWQGALTSLAALVALLWLTITVGIPALAREAAFLLPPHIDDALGDQALEVLDQFVFAPTALPEARQLELAAKFDLVAQGLVSDRTELVFRKSEIGANAFALPSGLVVITDELIALAEHDDEIVAVFAHELGHVQNRHTLRLLLQDSATAAVLIVLTGDVASVSALAASLPTILVQSSFSREFESEADAFAYAYLESAGIPSTRFTAILRRLEAAAGPDPEFSFLSTHPATEARVRDAE